MIIRTNYPSTRAILFFIQNDQVVIIAISSVKNLLCFPVETFSFFETVISILVEVKNVKTGHTGYNVGKQSKWVKKYIAGNYNHNKVGIAVLL